MADSQSGEAVVVCPVCEKTWPKETECCPEDGSWLHEETRVEVMSRAHRKSMLPSFGQEHSGERSFDRSFGDTVRVDPTLLAEITRAGSKELQPGTKAGEYEIEAKIGEGAMGTVYRAVHPAIGKHVAIKVMSPKLFDEPDAVQRFLSEARAVAAIRHPGIVDIFGYGRLPDGRTFLTMEWLEGQSLAGRLAQGPIPLDEALEILRQIARALEAAHGKNIAHRDLKPENVFLLQIEDGREIKLLDFGLAKSTDQEAGVGVTREGQILGTPLYMSPEQCRSKGVDHRTDIYALGCLAYQLLAGRVPFNQDNAAELISAHLMTPPPRARSFNAALPGVLDVLLVKMLAKDPAERPTLLDFRRTIGTLMSRTSMPMAAVERNDPTPAPGTLTLRAQLDDATTIPGKPSETAETQPDRSTAGSELVPEARSRVSGSAPIQTRSLWISVAVMVVTIIVIALGYYAFSSLAGAR